LAKNTNKLLRQRTVLNEFTYSLDCTALKFALFSINYPCY